MKENGSASVIIIVILTIIAIALGIVFLKNNVIAEKRKNEAGLVEENTSSEQENKVSENEVENKTVSNKTNTTNTATENKTSTNKAADNNVNTNSVKNQTSDTKNTKTDSKIVGKWYPTSAEKNGSKLELKKIYGSKYTTKDCLTLNADGTYVITNGLYNLEEDGLKGTYELDGNILTLTAKDDSEFEYTYSNGKIQEEIHGAEVTFTKK